MAKKLTKQQVYNAERKVQNEWTKRDFQREKMLEEVYKESIGRMQSQIDNFYISYANRTGLTRAEANKRIKNFNVPKWANEAAQAVKEKDFSPYTNEWIKTYNTKMYISRVELLKAELELEMQNMYSQEHAILDKYLIDEALAEMKRQAGILGNSASGSVERARRIVDADFYGTNFSERIWGRTGYYSEMRKEVFSGLNRIYTDMTGYRSERNRLMRKFQASEYEAMRLLRTESSRIRADASIQSAKDNGATHYINVAEAGHCSLCGDWAGKAIPIEQAEPGYNMHPFHPHCFCSSYNHILMEYKDGRTTLDDFEIVD